METLTVQAYLNETWTDIALIKYPEVKKMTGIPRS